MLIVGAKGFASELLEVFIQQSRTKNLMFFDDKNLGTSKLFESYPIMHTEDEVLQYFTNYDSEFTLGIGRGLLRHKMYKKFCGLGGKFTSVISSNSEIGTFSDIGEGSNLLSGCKISNGVNIGKGALVYYNCIITHDTEIGDFVEISPGATLLGRSKIGSFTQLGANSTIMPDIKIGNNVLVGAGALVTKDVPANTVVAGVPARIIRNLPALEF